MDCRIDRNVIVNSINSNVGNLAVSTSMFERVGEDRLIPVQNKNLVKEALKFKKNVKGETFQNMLQANPLAFLKFIADQYYGRGETGEPSNVDVHEGQGEKRAVELAGQNIVDIAKKIYPLRPTETHQEIISGINENYAEPILQLKGIYYQISPSEETINNLLRQANKLQEPNITVSSPNVNYQFKAIDALSSQKGFKWFETNKRLATQHPDVFWSKMQADLQIPNDQLNLLRSLQTTNREDLITSLIATYAYTIQVNTATTPMAQQVRDVKAPWQDGENWLLEEGDGAFLQFPSKQEAQEYYNKIKSSDRNIPTQHYIRMTVPGGINYIENEIAVPDIIPSITGHAQFSTKNGIGWFRSDDKSINPVNNEIYNKSQNELFEMAEEAQIPIEDLKSSMNYRNDAIPSKTRRIQEIQSDLFQKGRNREDLINLNDAGRELYQEDSYQIPYNNKTYIAQAAAGYYAYSQFEGDGDRTYEFPYQNWPQEVKDKLEQLRSAKKTEANKPTGLEKRSDNQFLQLLNKDNTWATVFVKSIIQDSAKKGYEKVLFPTGDTAAKVEGHETIEQFIENKSARLKDLNMFKEATKGEIKAYRGQNAETEKLNHLLNTNTPLIPQEEISRKIDAAEKRLVPIETEIKQVEKELQDAREGNLKISSIHSFYETVVFNILKKQGYSPVKITDEHKNGWYSVDVKPEHLQAIRFAQPYIEQQFSYSEDEMYEAAGITEVTTPYEFMQQNSPNKEQISKFLKANPTFTMTFGTGDSGFEIHKNHISMSLPEMYQTSQRSGIPFKTVIEAYTMHEISHAASWFALETGKNAEFVENLLSQAKEWHKTTPFVDQLRQGLPQDKNLPYAFKDVHEFVADAFGNPYFQQYLKNIPYKGENKSIWDKFIDWVFSLLGITRDNIYNRVIDYINSEKIQKDNEEGSISPQYTDMELIVRGNPRDYVDAATEAFTSDAVKTQVEEVFKKLPSAIVKLKDIAKLTNNKDQLNRIQSLLDAFNEVKGTEETIAVYVNMLVSAANIANDLNQQMNAADKMKDDLKKIYTMHSLLASAENLQFMAPLVREVLRILDKEGYDKTNPSLNRFIRQLDVILSIESSIKQNFIKSITPNLQNYYSSLYPNNITAQEIRAKIEELERKLATSLDAKDRRFYTDKIAAQQKLLLKIPTSEVFQKIFAGAYTDSSSLQMWLGTAAVNSHPLVASTVSLLRDLDIAISQDMLAIENNHQRKFTGIIDLKTLSLRNPTKTWEPITDTVTDVSKVEEDENGKLVITPMRRKMFVSQYQPAYLQKHFEFRETRDFYFDKYRAAKRAHQPGVNNNQVNIDKYYSLYINAAREKQAFEKLNSERRYQDEVYDMFDLLDKPISKEDGGFTSFRKERGDIFHQIENLEHQRDRATNLDDSKRYQDEINQKYIELKELRSVYDENGNVKTSVNLEIANIANEYYKQRFEYGDNILTDEGKASFDREVASIKDKLAKGFFTQEQFDAAINAITVTELEGEYFEKINEYSEKIDKATAKISVIPALASTFKGLNKDYIKNGYKKIKDLVKAFRDQNGIVDGILFTKVHPELVKQIKDIQQEMENLKNKASKLKGLSTEDSILLDELTTKEIDKTITSEEEERLKQLRIERADRKAAYRANKKLIDDYYDLLTGLSSLIDGSVTEYYLEEKNNQLNKIIAGSRKEIKDEVLKNTVLEDGEYLKVGDKWWRSLGKNPVTGAEDRGEIKDEKDYDAIDRITDEIAKKRAQPILEASDWWKDNHYTYYDFDEESKTYYPLDKPIYIWARTEPKNKAYIKAGQPSFKFKTYKVKDKYINNNHKEILPYIPINKVDKYVNEKYTSLDKDWKTYLEFLRKESYKAQEFYPREKKLGDLFPGIVKSSGELKVEATNKLLSAKNPLKGLRDFAFEAREEDDANIMLGASQSKYYSNARVLPTRFVGKLEADKQSSDIPGMILALTLAARKYNKLLELHPILESTRTVVSNLPVQETVKLAKGFSLVNVFSANKSLNKSITKTKETENSNLAKTMDFVLDTMLYGHQKDASIIQILGTNVDLQKLSTGLKHISSLAIFSFNSFVAIKNTLSAKVQGEINTNVARGFYTDTDFAAANWKTKNFIGAHFKDYKKFGDKSEIGQKITFFQVLRGTAYNAYGQKTQWTDLKNTFNYFAIIKNISEFELQVTQFLAMSRANKVKVNGNEVPFDEAFALNKNGDLEKLPGADVTQSQINAFIKKISWINRNINGAYRTDERNKAQKTVLGDLAFYLNGYVMPGILNRYDNSTYSIEAETITRGYWNQGMTFVAEWIKYRRGLTKQWAELDADERARVHRWLKEMGFIVAFGLLVGALGGGDDKKELRNNMAFQNYLLALAMSVKSETETFAPLPSMGLNELSRKLNSPFAALKQISNIIKVLENGWGYLLHSVNSDWYQKSVFKVQGVHDGFHDPGDPKVVANFLKFIGWSGVQFDPLERVMRVRQTQQLR